MRLDWFIPFHRRTKPGVERKPAGLLVRAVRAITPRWLRSDWSKSSRMGLARRVLKRIGPTWLSSPVRRVVQATCLLVFLTLFFYVAWPYTAKPAATWPGWLPVSVDAETGVAEVEPQPGGAGAARPAVGATVFLADAVPPAAQPGQPPQVPPPFGRFTVAAGSAPGRLKLTPAAKPTDEALGRMAFSVGPWAMHERSPDAPASHYADDRAAKERVDAEAFLSLDPLVSLSTAVAGRTWVWSLAWAGVLLLLCVFVPRGFCGYLCPLGTLIDLFDWAVGKRVTRFRVADDGWWVHIKYYLLLGVLVAATGGVLLSGFVAAIPVITRGLLFTLKPLHDGYARGWHNVPPVNAGHWVSIALFAAVLLMGLWKPRFWCKYVCPSGAVFSVANLFRATERKVESTCINCNRCVEVCPFDAIKPDFTTRASDCTLCQTCGGVCPTDAIKFVGRTNAVSLKVLNDPPTNETPIGRRGFLAAGVGLTAAVAGGVAASTGVKAFGANLGDPAAFVPVRPPGSVPEPDFLQLCIRCGECFRACPNDVLQPMGFRQGLEGLWTPHVKADWAGCEPSCNNCGQVCPTGAIRALPLPEKRAARMGLAVVNVQTCLPHAGKEACQLCVDDCHAAGYHAIEFVGAGTKADADGNPIDGTTFNAPVVRPDLCVGCGLCQTRCFAINVQEKKLLPASAIVVEAGAGKEDRLRSGSYVALRVKGKPVG
ncbi:MAG TPA: 4Fe-4S binding protein [Humisphaera sp.]